VPAVVPPRAAAPQTANLASLPPSPPAGLCPTDKYNGRSTPLKGKGCPPPDMKEAEFKTTKQFVQGTSFKDK
jgi:hypothetical protein